VTVRPELGATRARGGQPSPDGRPVIKPPVWTPEIPAYFYSGGLAGASAGLALLADARGEEALAARAWGTALAGALVSPALLISDLGRPARFLYMLRMFKVTSPMSVGSWILAGFGTATGIGVLDRLVLRRALGPAGAGARVAAALLGLPLSSYTAALIANTSVPVWHHARHELPFIFTAGAAMSAGAAGLMLAPSEQAGPARRLAIGGAAAEVALTTFMETRLGRHGVGAPYHEGIAGKLTRAATALAAGGAVLAATAGRRSRAGAIAAGATLTAAAVAERWAIFKAGTASALRPPDTVDPQRARITRGDTHGSTRKHARAQPVPPPGGADGQPGRLPVTPGSPAIGPR
jgi:Polysulphide reductase, NrfD